VHACLVCAWGANTLFNKEGVLGTYSEEGGAGYSDERSVLGTAKRPRTKRSLKKKTTKGEGLFEEALRLDRRVMKTRAWVGREEGEMGKKKALANRSIWGGGGVFSPGLL